jgi:hypothetical protein
MNKQIASYHQQGGITAETVSTNTLNQNNFAKVPSKKKSWYNNPWLIAIIGGIIATVIAGIIINNLT